MISLSEFCKQTLVDRTFGKWEVLSYAIDKNIALINRMLTERIAEYRKKFGDTMDLQFSKNNVYINCFTITADCCYFHKKLYIASVEFNENGIYSSKIYNSDEDMKNNRATIAKYYLGSLDDLIINNYNFSKAILKNIDKAFANNVITN